MIKCKLQKFFNNNNISKMSYKYRCPYCGYMSNSKRYTSMRICPKKPLILKIFNPHCSALPNK